ncbi:MAG: hypothetical protein DYG94_11000 [Leptolyngbya sp. PLA3]|nr:hypothetical protein [Phycisphaerales bacterium]MCE7969256.1 hypothetical protein [Leptolyngbya sp. PL-A3]GIK20364.1 MAG: hypothetical protein BroJett004_25280 [Planctomycetota bacterium]
MSDSAVLQRYVTNRDSRLGIATDHAEADACDDLGAFGWLRGIRDRAVMLELRRKDGSIVAIGYGWLERVAFDPSEGITLSAAGQKIRIKGRNLNAEIRPAVRLFEGIARHRVSWVREADRTIGLQAGDRETVIDSIEW